MNLWVQIDEDGYTDTISLNWSFVTYSLNIDIARWRMYDASFEVLHLNVCGTAYDQFTCGQLSFGRFLYVSILIHLFYFICLPVCFCAILHIEVPCHQSLYTLIFGVHCCWILHGMSNCWCLIPIWKPWYHIEVYKSYDISASGEGALFYMKYYSIC